MKWRTTAIYFLVLLLVGGVYLVMSARQKETARKEKESRRVFSFDAGAVKEIEIKSGENGPVLLEKGDKWRISQPIVSDVDRTAFAGFFSALRDVEQVRSIGKASDNLAAFGLDKPSLLVRLRAGSDWIELQVGGKNPDESARYARAGEDGAVFMISSATYDDLHKSLKDLRRKELFSWQPDQVKAVDVKWQSGDQFRLERQEGNKGWKSATQPDMEISARKVRDLLDDLHWLRAVDFAPKDAMPSLARVEARFELKDGTTSELRVGSIDETKKQAVAVSSEIEGPVLLVSSTISSIPQSAVSLADRSIISSDSADIREITWKTENLSGNLVWMDANTWGTREGGAAPKAVNNAWAVKRLLSFIDRVEYIEEVRPGSNPPEDTPGYVQFLDVLGKKNSLAWGGLDPKNSDPVTVWIQKDGKTREVKMNHEDVKRLNDSLVQLKT